MVHHSTAPSYQTSTNATETPYADEELEMAMKLEASPLAETSAGMTNLHNQLANLTLELHEIKKGK